MITVLRNAQVFDGVSAELNDGATVIVEDDRIREIGTTRRNFPDAQVIDCRGHVLMPGLIDAHFHAYTPAFDILKIDGMPPALLVSHARVILEGALQRGFTTVRDAGGGDVGLWMAIEEGLIQGPRFFFSGKAISQTGGHGDARPGTVVEPCGCSGYSGTFSVVADGVDEVRRAVREELRRGARQIKLFVSGGVVSPTDPIWMPQFTDEEISTAVHEASTRRTYVMAHCLTDEGARRCIKAGVRSIEHGTEISEDTARLIAAHKAFVVPTLSVVDVLRSRAADLDLPPMSRQKISGIYESYAKSIEVCTRAGVKLGLGSDLLGQEFHPLQGGELALRAEFNRPIDVLRSATSVNAELLQMSGQLGCIQPGAYADLLVTKEDPLRDPGLFRDSLANILLIMKGGKCIRTAL